MFAYDNLNNVCKLQQLWINFVLIAHFPSPMFSSHFDLYNIISWWYYFSIAGEDSKEEQFLENIQCIVINGNLAWFYLLCLEKLINLVFQHINGI